MILLLGLLAGMYCYIKIPVSLLPTMEYPGISIITEHPGSAPENIEIVITKPIERMLKTVFGIKQIISTSDEGKSRIDIEFQKDVDIKKATASVRERVDIVKKDFPKTVQESEIVRYDSQKKPVIIFTVDMDNTGLDAIRDYTENNLKQMLAKVNGVSEVIIGGGAQREIHIDLDQNRYEAKVWNVVDIARQIDASFAYSISKLSNDNFVRYIELDEKCQRTNLISDIEAYTESGRKIRLSDIATISYSEREKDTISRLNGQERITVYVQKASAANVYSVCIDVKRILAENRAFSSTIVFDQSEYVEKSISNVLISCVLGIVIIVIVLLFQIGDLQAALIVSVCIPLVFCFQYVCCILQVTL
jgi:HAE1 family hydrophobic/amphiphilic exporter-1